MSALPQIEPDAATGEAAALLGKNVAKLDDYEIERARDAESADPHTAALLALSDAIARSRGAVDVLPHGYPHVPGQRRRRTR